MKKFSSFRGCTYPAAPGSAPSRARRRGRAWAAAALALALAACASGPRVQRVDASSTVDLSGRWNDADARQVCTSLINDCLSSPRVAQFIQDYAAAHDGRLPACVVGTFTNDTSEHEVDTSIIAKTMEIAIVNSGRLEFVAGGAERAELRAEKQDQQGNAGEDTAAALGYETGAVLLLTGSVKSMVDRAGKTTTRSYFVSAELTNIETNTRLWMGENNEIKKVITQSAYRP